MFLLGNYTTTTSHMELNFCVVRTFLVQYLPHNQYGVALPSSLQRHEIQLFQSLPVVKTFTATSCCNSVIVYIYILVRCDLVLPDLFELS